MRLGSIFFAAAAALIISCDAASTATVTSSDAVQPTPAKSVRLLRSVKTGDDSEERTGIQLTSIDDLLAKLKINEAVALKNLDKVDDELMQKLRENPSWSQKIQSWKENDLNPTEVAILLKERPSLSRKDSTEWNAWKIYAAQYLRQVQGLS
ncbi:hypothetical protein JG687_00017445 [Phytophthora cactorum]|uniref:RxLR effector protein n=1 Tax=Phytophthora cactorum TaxID=29920 RepID=A0A329S364_9STRA|nr:hypothetical protein Pcac1_g15805 [Phytophthora cactorum]KAG2793229.1 hypothetical protein PC111_g23123 [Phytophthora cactorum]KAG2793696.1 hypothetical protein PC112_g23331 [Phytophthora cactorum]KAG2815966.1 hypothetical protein PC113_g23150 [Phytophthora cactorum]KAG2873218.1 hypothetical protein PC114_g25974 [Phytophthora cactorum]